eukprot:gene10312-2456_t
MEVGVDANKEMYVDMEIAIRADTGINADTEATETGYCAVIAVIPLSAVYDVFLLMTYCATMIVFEERPPGNVLASLRPLFKLTLISLLKIGTHSASVTTNELRGQATINLYLSMFPLDLEEEIINIENGKKTMTTKRFLLKDYLCSARFLKGNRVKRVVEMDKPSIFLDESGGKFLNEALPHPNLHKLAVPEEVKEQYQKNFDCVLTEYFFKVLCGSNQTMFDYEIPWCAFTYLGLKLPTSLHLLTHEGGTGKSFLLQFVCFLFGVRAVNTTDDRHITMWNSLFKDRSLVAFEEVPELKKELMDQIMRVKKDLITKSEINITGKGKDTHVVFNDITFIEMTNKQYALRLVEGQIRRFVCPDNSTHRLDDEKFWDYVYSMFPPVDGTSFEKPEDKYTLASFGQYFDALYQETENQVKPAINSEVEPEVESQQTKTEIEPEVEGSVDETFAKLELLDKKFKLKDIQEELEQVVEIDDDEKIEEILSEHISNFWTKGNLNFDFKQVNTYAKKMRDDLQREHPDKYEMSVTVKISMGQQSGKMIPTNMNYIYIYHPNVDGDYDEE